MPEEMTKKEVLDYLDGWIDSICDVDSMFKIDEIKLEVLSTAHEAVKKQIPEKPNSDNIFYNQLGFCGCGNTISKFAKYCGQCGQAIDWSE